MASTEERPYDPYIPSEPAAGGAGAQPAAGNQRTAALQAVSYLSILRWWRWAWSDMRRRCLDGYYYRINAFTRLYDTNGDTRKFMSRRLKAELALFYSDLLLMGGFRDVEDATERYDIQ